MLLELNLIGPFSGKCDVATAPVEQRYSPGLEALKMVRFVTGKGIAAHIVELRPGSVGIGLGGMRQRAREFGGELRVQNAQPGTLIEVTIPIKPSISPNRFAAASLHT